MRVVKNGSGWALGPWALGPWDKVSDLGPKVGWIEKSYLPIFPFPSQLGQRGVGGSKK